MNTSIIIPTAGRPVAISATIQSLLRTSPARHDAEIILVDNNPSQDFRDYLETHCAMPESPVRYVYEPSPGSTAARHRGAAEAKGDLLIFIDDDVEVSEGWLEAIQRAFVDCAVAVVGGPSIPKFTCPIPSWFWDYLEPTTYGGWMCTWLSLLDIGDNVPNIHPNYIWSLNLSIRKTVLEACGGFHPDLVPKQFERWQGDGETGLTMKVREAGYRADYLQDAWVLHLCGPDRLNVEYFLKRAYFQGVCDSFSEIRAGQVPFSRKPGRSVVSASHPLRDTVGRASRQPRESASIWAAEGEPVKTLTNRAYREGWLFHQLEVAADPTLLSWVRREDYFGTDIQRESGR